MGVGSWFGHYVRAGYDKALITNGISQVGGTKEKEVDFNIEIGKTSIKEKRRWNSYVEGQQRLHLTERKAMTWVQMETKEGEVMRVFHEAAI